MERKFIVDSITENKASLETEEGNFLTVELALLPPSAAEGDVIRIFIDREQTGRKKEEIRDLLKDMFE